MYFIPIEKQSAHHSQKLQIPEIPHAEVLNALNGVVGEVQAPQAGQAGKAGFRHGLDLIGTQVTEIKKKGLSHVTLVVVGKMIRGEI